MEYKKFKFDPEDGFLNEDFYEETPENSREILQRQHFQTRDYINSLVDTLNSDKEGSSGSESIKSPEIEGVSGNDVYSQLKDIKKQINEGMEGIIPDGSVSEIKLTKDSVTEEKIAKGAVTTEKLAEDTISPYANEVININGIPKEKYQPLSLSGSPSFLKELFAMGLGEDIYGKYLGKKRYMFKDNKLHTLDMETGEFTKISDFIFPKDSRIIPEDGDFIYAYAIKDSSDTVYVHIGKYIKEYDVGEEIRRIKMYNSSFSPELSDIFLKDGYIYIGTTKVGYSSHYNYIHKIPEDNIDKGEVTILLSEETKKVDNRFFTIGEDIVFGSKVYKNNGTENTVTLYSFALCEDTEGNIFMNSEAFPIMDSKTYLPKCANLNTINLSKSFLYKNYIYLLKENYLFRARLF